MVPAQWGVVDCDIAIDPKPKRYYERLTHFANIKRLAENPDPKEKRSTSATSVACEEHEDVMVAYDRPVN